MVANSHLTAIPRKTLPVPVRWLLSQGMIHGHVLDYGCGRCAEVNQTMLRWRLPEIKSVTSYDPHYAPYTFSNTEEYDVILNTYVLCALPVSEQEKILSHIKSLLRPNGVAYITVRNDEPDQGYGTSSRGTYQRRVKLPFYLLRETRTYRIYLLTRGNNSV